MSVAPRFCPQCGTRVIEGTAFCAFCGSQVARERSAPATASGSPHPAYVPVGDASPVHPGTPSYTTIADQLGSGLYEPDYVDTDEEEPGGGPTSRVRPVLVVVIMLLLAGSVAAVALGMAGSLPAPFQGTFALLGGPREQTPPTAAPAAVKISSSPTTAPTPSRPRPTSTPLLTPSFERGSLIYSESFNATGTTWPVKSDANIKYSIRDGRYNIEASAASGWNWICQPTSIASTAMIAEVSARLEEGSPSAAYGMLFRRSDSRNFYVVLVTGNGKWQFGKMVNGVWTAVVDWKSDAAVPRAGDLAALQVVAKGDILAFSVNGAQLGAVVDSSLSSGAICLSTNTLGGGSVRYSFDDLRVWELAK